MPSKRPNIPTWRGSYMVTGVPKTVINDTIEIMGAVPQDEFVEQALAIPPGSEP